MRTILAALVLGSPLGTACLQISTTGSSNGGGTTTGGSIGSLPPGDPCTSNPTCSSGICGLAGIGNCCAASCSTSDALCGAMGCDDGGSCLYPSGTDCGMSYCSGNTDRRFQCDGFGNCGTNPVLVACPQSLKCDDAGTTCEATCNSGAECRVGLSCDAGEADCLTGYCEFTFLGAGVSPELTVWNNLSYTAALPTGTDIQIHVRATNGLNSAVVRIATDYPVCDSVQHPSSPNSCPRNPDGSINLLYFDLPQAFYLTVFVTLVPSSCGGDTSPSTPTLSDLSASEAFALN